MAASKTGGTAAKAAAGKTTAAKKPAATKTAAAEPTRNDLEVNRQPSAGAPKRSTQKVGDTPAPSGVAVPKGAIRVPTNDGHVDIVPNAEASRVRSPRELNPLGVRPPKVYHVQRVGGAAAMTIEGTMSPEGPLQRQGAGLEEGSASPVSSRTGQLGEAAGEGTITKTDLIKEAKKFGVNEDDVRRAIEGGRLQPTSVAGDKLAFNKDSALNTLRAISQEPG